ncbi:MAG: reverse transcriptase/maturase family protein [Planctomycetota bacterium]
MKRHGNLWPDVLAWNNLVSAARKARRGKRGRDAVLFFEFDLEAELLRLKDELQRGVYRPGAFRSHWITRPKPRLISAAPYRDRVVHHALMNVLEPILDRRFHPYTFACRKGKGTHAAANRLQTLMGRYAYALQCDIRKFFPSIDHEILKLDFRRVVKDRRVLGLMDIIVDSSNEQEPIQEWFPGDDLFAPSERRRGLPIGNLTSQWFANWYLDGLDWFVADRLGIGGYVRYCDELREVVNRVMAFLENRRLRLHEERLNVQPCWCALTFVGFRQWATHRLLRKTNVRGFRRRLRWMRRAYAAGEIDWPVVKLRLNGWLGHAKQAATKHLLRRLSKDWVFGRGKAD